jgi:CDP-diacylglycerol--inositol 3-phosphatidyltransferase
VPNIIGYLRVLTLLAGMSVALDPAYWHVSLGLYGTSQLLDAFDGLAARALNQSSQFGAVLDMVTDRVSTVCLQMVLSVLYNRLMPAFVFLATLDLFSHWFHMYSSLVAGSKSHKQVAKDCNILLRLYYTSRPMLFTVCACQELVYMMLFVVRIPDAPRVTSAAWIILYCSLPLFIFKQVVNCIQLKDAANVLVALDTKEK